MKKFIYISLLICSYLGSKISTALGFKIFSLTGILLNTIFGIIGILIGYKIGKHFGN